MIEFLPLTVSVKDVIMAAEKHRHARETCELLTSKYLKDIVHNCSMSELKIPFKLICIIKES